MELQQVRNLRPRERAARQALLEKTGLQEDTLVEEVALLWDGSTLAATGSRQGNLLKCIAVDSAYQGEGLLAAVLTALRQSAFAAGHTHLFLYTKPENEYLFSDLFFYPIAKTQKVLLMEDRAGGIRDFVQSLPQGTEDAAALVMNCDPFTLGHRHVVATAARECSRVFVLVLSEDKGCFSAKDRLEMVKRGTADLPNVTVLSTGPYLISSATFPTYFLKDRDQAPQIQCALDIEIFVRYFVPRLQIRRRYVGQEPLSPMTAMYNEALKANLPPKGVQVVEIPRLETGGQPISASRVRALVKEGQWDAVKQLVPDTTYDYLMKLHQEEAL